MAKRNAFVIIDAITGDHLMHVTDAVNPNDPYWLNCITNERGNPHHQIHIHPETYNAMTHEDLHAHVANEFAKIKDLA